MELSEALPWASSRTQAVLITIRKDGRPQSSDISYSYANGAFLISVTDSRAKTRNMRRDNRVVLHLTERDSWSYVSFDGLVEVGDVATSPDDAACDALAAYYESVAGKPHPDWAEYRQAMVDEGRLLLTFTPTSVVGQINGPA